MSEKSVSAPSSQEAVKTSSCNLRGNVAAELADAQPYVSDASYELLKFHGSYQGYDRDTATERKKAGLEKEWEFMLRLKLPAGQLAPAQYLALDALCDTYANGTLRITTRQTFQFHCIIKGDLKPFIAAINRLYLTTLGGCGDVVRNIMACPAPIRDTAHETLRREAFALAHYVAPTTGGYLELFLDGEKVPPGKDGFEGLENWVPQENRDESEPLYGPAYLPRKFKIGIAPPWDNCIDVFTNDIAALPLFERDRLTGYNIAVGGGLGITHNKPATYARLASPLAFVGPDELIRACDAIIRLQRDHGDRSDRKHARLKYVVEENGPDWTRDSFARYFDAPFAPYQEMGPIIVEDHMGWHEQGDGLWFLGLPIPSGRIQDAAECGELRTALGEIIARHKMPLTLTPDQNLILCDIREEWRAAIEETLKAHKVPLREAITPLDRWMLACVALPTCGKALAEAERIREPLLEKLNALLARYGLANEPIAMRITGCPNGCARPYVGDVGIVGRTPGTYALYLGGDFEGTRLNEKIFDRIPFDDLPDVLEPMLREYAGARQDGEGFGDFWHRRGVSEAQAAALAIKGERKWAV